MTRRIAANPIPYWAKAGKTREVFERAFTDLAEIGFTAVKADVLDGMSAAEYARWIDGFGLSPSLSLFSSPLDETVEMGEVLERARGFAATQAELGLDRAMLSSMAVPARMERPAVGAGFDQGRLDRAVENAGKVCEVLVSEGIRPLHHSHVGGVFETEHEVTTLLDTLGPDLLGFGPDTGHLFWAGADPVALIRRYADRIGGIHLKDVYADHLPAREARGSYREISDSGRLWAEPGRGVLDLGAVLEALPDDYDGDYMIEVDHPSVSSVAESHRLSFAWAKEVLGAVTVS
ncbi:sugar phosphate isomerase/epimerase family protein [Kineococcus rhizosphaerae]|uniref:Inosose dehydratase n=1 Tax=Kineococcus rhizosphaerae TaxID=559628 RepID=A0A2T0R2H2_9ACTN|nr:sugar phosphate isomerase/epimerase [Kineococcus rhizosphaerae]PRY14008.1 inosose dehydratase [Kineococcus rhizosphaerae]